MEEEIASVVALRRHSSQRQTRACISLQSPQVRMTARRTKPEIGQVQSDESSSCTESLGELIFWGFAAFIFVRIISGTATEVENTLCVGTGIVFAVMLYRNDSKWKKTKEEWRAACKVDWLTIMDRRSSPSVTFEDGYGEIHSSHASYELYFEMNADQRAAAPYEEVVRVDVSGQVYNSLLGRKTACIYYQPESPLKFLIGEEFSLQ